MITVYPHELSERENYKFLIGSVIPRPVAVVSTMSDEGVLNIAPFSYFNIVTSNPPILSISIQRNADGGMKDTARNLIQRKEGVVHVLDEGIVENANQTAASLAPSDSELDLTSFHLVDSTTTNVPGIKEARVRFEVELYRHVEILNKEAITADLVLLKVKAYHIEDHLYDKGRIDPQGLQPVSRLAGSNYSKLGELFSLERPN